MKYINELFETAENHGDDDNTEVKNADNFGEKSLSDFFEILWKYFKIGPQYVGKLKLKYIGHALFGVFVFCLASCFFWYDFSMAAGINIENYEYYFWDSDGLKFSKINFNFASSPHSKSIH